MVLMLMSVDAQVDRHVFLMASVFDENLSWYLEDNINRVGGSTSILKGQPEFRLSNQMHSKSVYCKIYIYIYIYTAYRVNTAHIK